VNANIGTVTQDHDQVESKDASFCSLGDAGEMRGHDVSIK
jgi:hypothetical protein